MDNTKDRQKHIKKHIFKIRHKRAYEISKKVGGVFGAVALMLLLALSMFSHKK